MGAIALADELLIEGLYHLRRPQLHGGGVRIGVASSPFLILPIAAELNRVSEGTDDSQKFVGRLTDFSREYLREMIALPTTAVDHFAGEIEKISKPAAGKPAPQRVGAVWPARCWSPSRDPSVISPAWRSLAVAVPCRLLPRNFPTPSADDLTI